MKPKPMITVLLMAFVIVSVIYLAVKPSGEQGPSEATGPGRAVMETTGDQVADEITDQVVVYYFHGHTRCMTCRKLEAYAAEAVGTAFPKALENGRLKWKVVNFEEAENRHFVGEFGLHSASLVIANWRDGEQTEWKSLGKIWGLVGDKPAYLVYVREEVKRYLAGD